MAQDRAQFRRREPHVERHHHGVGLGHAEVAFEQLVGVEAEVADAVAGLDAAAGQGGGQPLAALAELGVSEPLRSADDRLFGRTDRRRGADTAAASVEFSCRLLIRSEPIYVAFYMIGSCGYTDAQAVS